MFRCRIFYPIAERRAFINITGEVERCLKDSGIREGLILVNPMQSPPRFLSMMTNLDYTMIMNVGWRNWPPNEPVSQYLHNRTGEDNGDAHLKRQVMGREVVVAVTGGKLDFGPWEQIFYGEFDGGRRKSPGKDYWRIITGGSAWESNLCLHQ
jgi:secondary thiamine-phosphate synthase enzyme